MAADRPGPRSKPPGTAELLCALSYGSGLAAAEQMEHGTNTAFVGVQLGRALGVGVFPADFAAGLGFGPHVRDAVHYQYERHDGRSPAFGRPAEMIPRPAKILHLALAADLVRGLSGADAAAAMVSQRTGTYVQVGIQNRRSGATVRTRHPRCVTLRAV